MKFLPSRHIYFAVFFFLFFLKNTYANIYINEIFATNASVNMDVASTYNFSGWIELYNSSASNVNLNGYYLSDSRSNPKKWQIVSQTIKAKSFLYFWTDKINSGIHTNFNLSGDGEFVGLYDSNGNIVDTIAYPKQQSNYSWGRYPDGASTFAFFKVSSLGTANSQAVYSVCANPEVSVKGGFFTSTGFKVYVTCSTAESFITYTLNGSEPLITSAKCVNYINITQTCILRVKAWNTNAIGSEIVTNTYFLNARKPDLPVVSLSTDSKYLTDNTIGMMVVGTNGISGNCTGASNYNQDWERPMSFEFFDKLGNQVFSQYIGAKIAGACSRNNAQKSLNLLAKSKYGKSNFNYKFFEKSELTKFNSLMLRNSGNDFNTTQMRDDAMQAMLEGIDIDGQNATPVVVYLNGEYLGVMSIKERLDEDWIEAHHKYDADSVNVLDQQGYPMVGVSDEYNSLISWLNSSDLVDNDNYTYVTDRIDIDEYINYMIAQIYLSNTDWPGNNIKIWKPQKGGKWRWAIYDTDFGFGLYGKSPSENTLTFALTEDCGCTWPNPSWSTFLFRKLMENTEFQTTFIQRYSAFYNTFFKPERITTIIDSVANLIDSEMSYHTAKWGGSYDSWLANVQVMRDFGNQRADYVLQFIKDYFGLTNTYSVTLRNNNKYAGYFQLNGANIKDSLYVGNHFSNIPVSIKSIAKEGFRFLNNKTTLVDKYKTKQDTSFVLGADEIGFYKNINTTQFSLIANGDSWKYLDNGSNQGTTWRATTFDDSSWKTGYGQFGYGDGDETTILGYGSSSSSKYITSYFRKTFTVNSINGFNSLNLNILRDDGVVVYLNGVEVGRQNMPLGTILYSTLASSSEESTIYYTMSIPISNLNVGKNVLAIELHQVSTSSSDVSFDANLAAISSNESTISVISEGNQNQTAYFSDNVEVKANFAEVESIKNIKINEFVANNTNGLKDENGEYEDWIELYNNNDKTINVSGLYLTDSINTKTLWKIKPTNVSVTEMKPYSYLVFYADKETKEGDLHADFKLSQLGEAIALSQIVGRDTVLIDSVSFKTQYSNISIGRYSDGIGPFSLLAKPTPGAPNEKPNLPPIITSEPVLSVKQETEYQYNITANDPEGYSVKFSFKKLPVWLYLSDNGNGTATLQGVPAADDTENQVIICVCDGVSSAVIEQEFTIKIEKETSVTDNITANTFSIYPNPVAEILHIQSCNQLGTITVFDVTGQIVFKSEESNRKSLDVNVKYLKSGIYMVQTKTSQGISNRKFIKN